MKKILGGILLLAIILPGCSYIYSVRVIGNNTLKPQFILNKPMWVSPIGKPVPLTSFSVIVKDGEKWNHQSPIWRIKIQPGIKRRVGKIYYGQTPDGFIEEVKSKKLVGNKPYMAKCFGRVGGHGGRIEFMIVKDRGVYRIVTKKKAEEVWESDITH